MSFTVGGKKMPFIQIIQRRHAILKSVKTKTYIMGVHWMQMVM